MNVLIYLVPLALALGLTGLAAFLWTLKSGQYDDLEGVSLRVLSDDDVETARRVPDAVEAPTGQGRPSS